MKNIYFELGDNLLRKCFYKVQDQIYLDKVKHTTAIHVDYNTWESVKPLLKEIESVIETIQYK